MIDVSCRLFKVFNRDLLVFRRTWMANIMFNLVEPLFYLAAMGFGLGVYIPSIKGLSYLEFIAPALIATSAMWAAASECTYHSFVRMHYQKTYHAIVATPLSVDDVVAGELAFGAFKSVFYGSIILAVIAALNLTRSPLALLVPLSLVLCGLVFAELGMLWTALVPNIDTFSYFFTLVITPMFLFSGVFFPLDNLPAIVQAIAFFLPLYHMVELIRGLVLGSPVRPLLGHAAWLLFLAALLFYPPLALMRRRLIK